MDLLQDKVAIITGGTRGIGKAMVEQFSQQGCRVAFTYLSSDEKAKAIEKELGDGVKSYKSDASSLEDCEKLVEEVLEYFGRIDILVNNAGITKDGLLLRMSPSDWSDVIKANLDSVFNLTKVIQKTFLRQRHGSIINLSSVVGIRGNAGQSNYAASKAGIIGFTKSIALELGSRNIRCNAIAPGFIETEMTEKLDPKVIETWSNAIPLKRAGKAKDVADAAVFLASDSSAYITGQVLQVDGGMLT